MHPKKLVRNIGVACFIAIPIWLWIGVPYFERLGDDFHYAANIESYDNFYNEDLKAFGGENPSTTRFSYDVVFLETEDVVVIKNIFEVRTADDGKIFSVERLYGIDQKTARHVPGFGDKNQEGYLFAPRHLKKGEPFTYWHVNYNGPAHMTFAGEEKLHNLRVYRYETRYLGVRIDQTENLGHLPGVPETRGVELEPYLQLWIEPVTGRLVKYEDQTIAYYYNIQTGERLKPWNKFRNSFSGVSIARQVQLAKQEKTKFTVLELVVPGILGIIGMLLIAYYNYSRKSSLETQ